MYIEGKSAICVHGQKLSWSISSTRSEISDKKLEMQNFGIHFINNIPTYFIYHLI